MNRKPNFQPLSFIPTMTQLVNQELEQDQEQLELLSSAKDKPHVFDDALVERMLNIYESKLEMYSVYEQQAQIWKNDANADKHKESIEHIAETVQKLKLYGEKIYNLTKEISEGTIDKVLQKSDAELGLEELLKQFGK